MKTLRKSFLVEFGLIQPLTLVLLSILCSSYAIGPTLTGTVLTTDSEAIQSATVFVFSAGPRVGTSSFCPTCYPDCRKHVVTDSKGAFRIEELDPNLIFKLLVVNKSYRPLFVPQIDPLKGPVELKLFSRPEEPHPFRCLRGRVLDPQGKPVERAVVEFDFFLGEEANCGGQCEGVDPVAVTDRDGKFYIGSEKKFDWMTIRVEAPLFARRKFFQLSSEKVHDLKLTDGATVTGRVVVGGKPMKGIAVGLVSVDRSDNFTGNFDTYTSENGRFAFLNVPPYHMYFVYTAMDSAKADNMIAPARRVRVAADGTTRDVGDLTLQPGARVRGRVVLADGKPVPSNTQLYVGREGPWDSRNVVLNSDGTFDLRGIPCECIALGVNVRGYRLSGKNKSLDRLNGGTLTGTVAGDTYVEILLEPGEFTRSEFYNVPPDELVPRDKPLEGAAAQPL